MAVQKKRKMKPLFIIIIILTILLLVIAGTWIFLSSPVNRKDKKEIEIIIPSGATTRQIGTILKEKGLIRNELFYNIYLKLYRVGPLKASTYSLSKDMSLKDIVESLELGNSYNPNVVKITFREGERITDYAEVISKRTNYKAEDFLKLMQDRTYIATLIDKYWFLSPTILNQSIYYPLEGYLAPNTYEFESKDVSLEAIVETLLNRTEKVLEPYKGKVADIHYIMTMASIVELEGTNTENRKQIVGVFQNRLSSRMSLGSDVTTYYALQLPMTSDLTTEQFNVVNPYNTRSSSTIGKMPIGPICNPSLSSIEASIAPTASNNLYFVADKYGKIYFTKTLAEHNAKVKEIKDKGDWIW